MPNEHTRWLSASIGQIDLHFQGVEQVIAAWLLPVSDGLALVECGPGSTLAALDEGIRALGHDPDDIRYVLVTHIHLDHAGAAGLLLQRQPEARLFVHEVGAPHLADPTNLIRSATRIYGDQMDTLWGEFLPVPEERMTVVTDGDVIDLAGRQLRAVYTPGHASHHVVWQDLDEGVVFTGDVAGITIQPVRVAIPPAPPPDIDIERWHASIQKLREMNASQLLLTHFGAIDYVAEHLDDLDRRLDELTGMVGAWIANGVVREEMVARLTEWFEGLIQQYDAASVRAALEFATPYFMTIDGMSRYFRKRAEREGATTTS